LQILNEYYDKCRNCGKIILISEPGGGECPVSGWDFLRNDPMYPERCRWSSLTEFQKCNELNERLQMIEKKMAENDKADEV